jgi:hypothetical protein
VTRWLSILLAVVLGGLSPSNARALTRAGQAAYDAGAAGEKVVFVAGITMDTSEGSQTDPLSLHKYLYCADSPIMYTDPSGHDLTETLVVAGIGATIGGFSSAVASVAQGRAITAASVFQGAALGAVLGPLAYYAPAVGVGLGIGGAVYSGLTFGPILLDPGATTQQKVASGALIVASIYGAQKGFDYAKAANAGAIPQVPPDPTYVILEHGTTLSRASQIFAKGPNPEYVEPSGTRAGGFSTSKVDSPTMPVGSPGEYAAGKASAFPNEGGPAVLRIAIPKNIYDLAIKAGNEVRFEKGHGLDELIGAWNKSIYRYPPKQ